MAFMAPAMSRVASAERSVSVSRGVRRRCSSSCVLVEVIVFIVCPPLASEKPSESRSVWQRQRVITRPLMNVCAPNHEGVGAKRGSIQIVAKRLYEYGDLTYRWSHTFTTLVAPQASRASSHMTSVDSLVACRGRLLPSCSKGRR